MIKLTTLMLLCIGSAVQAQITVSGEVTNAGPGEILVFNVPYENWYYKEKSIEVRPDSNGTFTVMLDVTQPQTFFMRFREKNIHLYGEPGKTLSVQFDALHPERLVFGGALEIENTFRSSVGLSHYTFYPVSWSDSTTSPPDIFSLLQQDQQAALEKLSGLKKASTAFLRITKADIDYLPLSKLWYVYFDLQVKKLNISIPEWKEALIGAYSNLQLSNDKALDSYHYQTVITYYPRYMMMKEGKELAEKLFNMPFETLKAKGQRYVEYALWQYGLEGRALERAMASFIIHGIYQGDMAYLGEAYDDFLKRYPASIYRNKVNEVMKPYLAMKEKEHGFEFIIDNRYKTVEEIIVSHKGRVVYIDLWGTWCGPCREQLSHTAALKERFKNEPVDFVYVAFEKTGDPVKAWKETISFYNLAGQHILAGKELKSAFSGLYKTHGGKTMALPAYLLVDKNGALVTAHAYQPSSGEKLYEQISHVLAQQ